MRRLAVVPLLFMSAALAACHPGAAFLPSGEKMGAFQDVDRPESYSGATLYAYLDGGADFFLNQGFSALYVRRYGHDKERFTAELFEMKDPAAAARVYAHSRRPNAERELVPGCLATVTSAETQVVRGRYYLETRNDDPLTTESAALIELSTKLLNEIPGGCAAVINKR